MLLLFRGITHVIILEETLITMVEIYLNNSHVPMEVEQNFTLDLTKANIANMRTEETVFALYSTMAYKIQLHLF